MTETITLPGGQVVESPHTPRPASDGAARHAIEDATAHLRERILDRIADAVNKFCGFGKEMPGRQRDIQDCVDKILAKIDPAATAG
jgi:hypothetical protein